MLPMFCPPIFNPIHLCHNEFNFLQCVSDCRASGSWILVSLDQQLNVTVFKCPPKIRLLHSHTYIHQTNLTFMQCPNVTSNKVGLLGVLYFKEKASKANAFSLLKDGIIEANQCTLCLCQQTFINDNADVIFIVHLLREAGKLSTPLVEVMRSFQDCNQFCKTIFEPMPSIFSSSEISILYLNQISGPRLLSWGVSKPVFSLESGYRFLEAKLQPDQWTNSYLYPSISEMDFISFPMMIPRNNCQLGKKWKNKHSFLNIGMKKLRFRAMFPTDVYYCISSVWQNAKKGESIQMVEILTENDDNMVLMAPIADYQFGAFVSAYQSKEGTLSTEEHNALLFTLMRQSGKSPISLLKLSPNHWNATDCFIISILPENVGLPVGPNVVSLTPTISKVTLPNNLGGAFDVEHGVPVQYVYSWPFERVVKKVHLKFIHHCIRKSGTNRTCSPCVSGQYQNLGLRTTSRARGSLVSSPSNTVNHHHYHEGFDKSCMPTLTGLKNHLREQAKESCIHSGEPFSTALMKARKMDKTFDVLRGTLLTWGGFSNTVHRDLRDFTSSDETSIIRSLLEQQKNERFHRLLNNYHLLHPGKTLPTPTTCCWCPPVDSHCDYKHRQYFLNLTAKVAIDLSQFIYDEYSPQIGSTFYGGIFDHCSARPLWTNNRGQVRITQPCDGNNYFWNFAWGVHP